MRNFLDFKQNNTNLVHGFIGVDFHFKNLNRDSEIDTVEQQKRAVFHDDLFLEKIAIQDAKDFQVVEKKIILKIVLGFLNFHNAVKVFVKKMSNSVLKLFSMVKEKIQEH